jgi:biopolymer transport protein ExbB
MKRTPKMLFLMLLCCAGSVRPACPQDTPAGSEKLDDAMAEVQEDIQRDTQALNQLREEIAAQRKPLADRLDRLRAQVAEQRSEAERIRELRRQGEEEQAALKRKVSALEEECRFLLTVFSEYARAMETRISTAESAVLTEQLRPINEDLVESDSFAQLPRGVDALLKLTARWNRARLGGMLFNGTALDDTGREHAGRFAAFGPVALFAAETGHPAGPAVTQFGSMQPVIYDAFDRDTQKAVARVVAGAEATVPVDVSAGDAIKIEEAETTWTEHVRKGGFVIIPLLAVGALALVLIVWKTIELSRIRVRGNTGVHQAMQMVRTGDIQGAELLIKKMREPLASLAAEAVAHRRSSREHIEEIMHEHVLGALPRLERHLGTLAVLGGVAPLLGLLGTVTGMIHTFQLVTIFGSGDAKLLSGGISEALVTTEFGLAIAIPVLLAHAFLARRARSIIGTLEQTAVNMVNDLKVRTPDE